MREVRVGRGMDQALRVHCLRGPLLISCQKATNRLEMRPAPHPRPLFEKESFARQGSSGPTVPHLLFTTILVPTKDRLAPSLKVVKKPRSPSLVRKQTALGLGSVARFRPGQKT
jgi:hypothetical protein